MGLSELASLATIANFILFALVILIDRWSQMVKKGGPLLPKIALIFLILGIISSGVAVYTSWYLSPSTSELYIGKGMVLSKNEEMVLKQLIQEYKEPPKQSPLKLHTLPPLGEKAVPDLPLYDRPTLEFTDKEIRAIIKASPEIAKKILKNQVKWRGYADIADITVEGYRDYIRTIFGGEKPK